MAEFRISGVWKNDQGVITHYAVHTRTPTGAGGYQISHATKTTKANAVALLQNPVNTAKTYLWNYGQARWIAGEDVHVVNGTPSFLRTNHDGILRDNLGHLIDYGYVFEN